MAVIQFGGYVSPWKVLAIVILLGIWAWLLTWIDKDTLHARLPRSLINSIMIGALIAGYLAFFFLPGFGLAFGVLALFFLADIGTYLGMRAAKIGLGDLTGQISVLKNRFSKKGETEEPVSVGGQLVIMGKNGAVQNAPSADSAERLGWDAAQQLLTNPIRYGAERLEMTAGESASINYVVDGVRYEGEPLERNRAAAAVQFLKRISGLDMMERRKPQTGVFRTLMDNERHEVQITTMGSAAGESMRLITDPKSRHDFKLDTLGFSDDQLAIVQNTSLETGGLVLFAAPSGHGLTTLEYAAVRSHDAFMYHVHTVERAPELELEGITQNKLPANSSPADELKQVQWVLSQEPDVVLVGLVENPQSAAELSRYASDQRRVYAGLHAVNTFDAIRQWRKMVGDDALAVENMKVVVAGRLVRRLCSACKVGYQPDPNQLRKLNIDPGSVSKLYLARKEPMRDAKGNIVPCTFCYDLAFKGRFGVFEVFVIDDEVKQIIRNGGSDNLLKQAFRKQQQKLLQEMALAHVQVGETSVEEVLRVLRGDSHPPAAAHRSAGGHG
jgi:type II secretory ATPase GspE/PulE/Tfp pilus assembly ATPase PilB-like protein